MPNDRTLEMVGKHLIFAVRSQCSFATQLNADFFPAVELVW